MERLTPSPPGKVLDSNFANPHIKYHQSRSPFSRYDSFNVRGVVIVVVRRKIKDCEIEAQMRQNKTNFVPHQAGRATLLRVCGRTLTPCGRQGNCISPLLWTPLLLAHSHACGCRCTGVRIEQNRIESPCAMRTQTLSCTSIFVRHSSRLLPSLNPWP